MYAISTDAAPRCNGPFSQGTSAARYVFVSQQQPVDPATGELVSGGVARQTQQCLKNVEAVLGNLDLTLADVTKLTILLADINELDTVYGVCDKLLGKPRPACSCAQVVALPNSSLVTIEAVACR